MPHLEAVERLKAVAGNNGVRLTDEQCIALWEAYSNTMCAGWMGLPNDDGVLWQILEPYMELRPRSSLNA